MIKKPGKPGFFYDSAANQAPFRSRLAGSILTDANGRGQPWKRRRSDYRARENSGAGQNAGFRPEPGKLPVGSRVAGVCPFAGSALRWTRRMEVHGIIREDIKPTYREGRMTPELIGIIALAAVLLTANYRQGQISEKRHE